MSITDQARETSFSTGTPAPHPSPKHHRILPPLKQEDFDRAGKLGIDFSVRLGIPFVITPTSLLVPFAVSAGVGVLFGLYPALRAARLDPIEALRSL